MASLSDAEMEALTVEHMTAQQAENDAAQVQADEPAEELEPHKLTEAEELELIAEENELMTLEEFSELLTFGMGLPGAWVPDLAGLAIAENEVGAAREAFAATRRLLIRAESLHFILKRREGSFGDALAAGAFFLMKGRIVAAYIQARKAEKAKPETFASSRTLSKETSSTGWPDDDPDGIEVGA